MRFMLLQNYGEVESDTPPLAEWAAQDVKTHIDFQMTLNQELAESGELVNAQALTGPEVARFVVSDGTSAPVVTDGAVPRVEGAARRISARRCRVRQPGDPDRRQGVGGARTERLAHPPADRGARGAGRPRPGGVSTRPNTEGLLRELAPQVLGAMVRRHWDFADVCHKYRPGPGSQRPLRRGHSAGAGHARRPA
jgi:hypothetical protein